MPGQRAAPPPSIAARLGTAESLCQQRGKRLTPIRRKVLEILLCERRSLKAYALPDEVRRAQPGAVPPTIYRALDFLVEEGLINRPAADNAWPPCPVVGADQPHLPVVCTLSRARPK